MPYVRRNEAGEIAGMYQARQHEGQEFLADDSAELNQHLVKRESRNYKKNIASLARKKMMDRLFADAPEKVTCDAGEAAIDAAQDEAGMERAFQKVLKSFQ